MGRLMNYGWKAVIMSSVLFSLPLSADKASSSPSQGGVKNAQKEKPNNDRFSLTGEFLYLQPKIDHVPYVASSKPLVLIAPFTTQGFTDLDAHQVHFGFNPAFRLGVGYQSRHDKKSPYNYWDIALNWTDFRTRAHGSISAGPDLVLGRMWSQLAIAEMVTEHASAKQKLNLDTIDLELGRDLVFTRKFTLRPHIGLRGAIIDQDLDAVYDGVVAGSPYPPLVVVGTAQSIADVDQDFHGIGLRGGLDLQWNLKWGLGLYGQSAVSLLWSKFDVSMKENYTSSVSTFSGNSSSHFHTGKSAFELELGLNWEVFAWREKVRFAFNAGYQFNYWPNMNQLYKIQPLGADPSLQYSMSYFDGDLTYHGLALGATIAF